MYIKSLIYEDQSTDWKLELMEFKPLTLLVGASGVGKTQILNALLNLKKIANGRSLNGLKWEIKFVTSIGHDCKWSGAFENKGFISGFIHKIWEDDGDDYDKDDKYKPYISYEQLLIDGNLVVNRNKDGILFNDKKTVKLSQKQSVLSLLKEEEQIQDVYENFRKILFESDIDYGSTGKFGFDADIKSKSRKYKSLKAIRNSDENINTKFRLLYKNQKNSFEKIVEAFIDIFPHVEKIKIEPITNNHEATSIFVNDELTFIHLKEKNVTHWIDEFRISLGMWKTLMHLAELHLCADDTVILIDEFENSLGINCIDQITHSILASDRNLQFIITSHHPYIINNIGVSHWKIITRNGNIVTATDAEAFGIGHSKHQAFTQLINLDAYTDGIAD